MKKSIFVIFFAINCFCSIVWAEGEVAFVDMQEVFRQFYKTALAQDQIKQQVSDIKVESDAMATEIKKMKEEVEVLRNDSRDKTLSKDVRDGKIERLEEKLVELQKLTKEMLDYKKLRNEQLNQQKNRMLRKLFDEITSKINEYAKEMGFVAVVDCSTKGQSGVLVVLYVDNKKNITADVVSLLNEESKKEKKNP